MSLSKWELHVALPQGGPLVERVAESGASPHFLRCRDYTSGYKTVRDFVAFITDVRHIANQVHELERTTKPDLIYVNGPRLMPAVALSDTCCPVLFHSHNIVTIRNGRLLVELAIHKTGATVIAASMFAGRQWKHCRTIYSGVEGPPEPLLPIRRRLACIGLVGRVEPQKRQMEFVAAAKILLSRHARCEFVVCGETRQNDRAAERYKAELLRAAPDGVRFLGWREPIYEVLRNLDLLIMPSTHEGGFPRVLLEAFACGVPVLAADAGAVPEVLEEGRNGFLLPASDPITIATRIEEVLSDPEQSARIAVEARRLWQERFTAERFARDVVAVIGQTVGQSQSTP